MSDTTPQNQKAPRTSSKIHALKKILSPLQKKSWRESMLPIAKIRIMSDFSKSWKKEIVSEIFNVKRGKKLAS
jgi:hypothetical protein